MMKSLFPIISNNDLFFPDYMMNRFFGDMMKPLDAAYSVPKADIEDKDNAYVLTMDLPGVAKEDISLSYENDVLTLSAHHEDAKSEEDEQKHYIRRERVNRSFCRQFRVGNIRREDIQAAFKDGVLTITLPKESPKQVEAAKTIEIQ